MALSARGCLQAPTALLAIPVAAASARAAAAASRPGRELQQRSSANRLWQHHIVRPRRAVRAAASAGGQQPSDAAEPEESEEFLWRYLQHKQGFTAEAVQRMQQTMEQAGRNIRCDKAWVLRNVEPSMRLLLRDEKLTPEVMQQLCRKWPYLLAEDYTSFATCMAELRRRQLAEDVPEDRRAPALPDGTRLGAELCRRPAVLAELLCWPFLDSCIAITRAAHCKLGICSGDTAAALLQSPNILATDDGQAEAMVSHLHGLIASGVQSQEQVHEAVLTSGVLCMEPVELNRQLLEAVWQATNVKDPASREQHAAAALGELLQTAAGVPLPLQPQYHDQAAALVERCPLLWTVPADRLRAAWASLCRLGLTDSQVTPLVRSFPVALSVDWGGAMMQRRAAFFQEVLGLALAEGVGINPRYATASLARMEMRTAILKQERPAVWAAALRRGAIAVLDLLTGPRRSFCRRAGCTPEELGEFERRWRGRRGK